MGCFRIYRRSQSEGHSDLDSSRGLDRKPISPQLKAKRCFLKFALNCTVEISDPRHELRFRQRLSSNLGPHAQPHTLVLHSSPGLQGTLRVCNRVFLNRLD